MASADSNEITMDFRFDGATGKFDASVMGAATIVGCLVGDTIKLTFERE